MRWVPSGSSVTAPAIVGAPTVAIAWLTAVIIKGSDVTPGSSAPSPQTTRSGGSSASWRWRSMFSRATATSSSAPTRSWTEATSTWIVATSRVRPSGAGIGIAAGTTARTRAATARTSAAARRPLPHRSHASRSRPATTITRKDRAHTPPMDARGNAGASTCVTPSCPQPNPPSGIAPRIHSMMVHRPASPSVPSRAVLAPPDGRRQGPERRREARRHDHERRPPELAEQEDPIQECPEVGEPEREAAQRRPARARAPHQPQERDRRHEHDRPEPDGRQGDRQQRAGDRCDQEGDREPEPARAQAQSRQSIFALSFSWLRCLTR